jgi:hypothetical protein
VASPERAAFPALWLSTALGALGLVLIAAAVAKLRSPASRRRRRVQATALGELALGVLALAGSSRLAAALLCVVFATFTVLHLRAVSPGCGCLGDRPSSAPRLSGGLTALAAAIAALAALEGPRSTAALLAARPLTGAAVAAGAVAGACIWLVGFSGRRPPLPPSAGRSSTASQRLVNAAALVLERRISRRSALLRLAIAGSALAVAPLRYLLYPGSALAAILPGDCASGLCTDGYTVFCCEINQGSNTCPEGTFPGGWWMCTDYAGGRLCGEQGVRYYVDCNQAPGSAYPGGCRCADDSCAHRRVACNVFRYGQCNPQVPGVTAVVCRMVVCENPSRIAHLNCSSSVAVDDSVCGQDVACLEPAALQLPGAGGV